MTENLKIQRVRITKIQTFAANNGNYQKGRNNFMAVTVVIPTPLRQFAGGSSEIEIEATTAGEALEKLTTEHAELKKHLYNDGGNLRNFVNVYVGDEDIRDLD